MDGVPEAHLVVKYNLVHFSPSQLLLQHDLIPPVLNHPATHLG